MLRFRICSARKCWDRLRGRCLFCIRFISGLQFVSSRLWGVLCSQYCGKLAVETHITTKRLHKIVREISEAGECVRIPEVIAKVEEQIGKMGKARMDLCTRILIDVAQAKFAKMMSL